MHTLLVGQGWVSPTEFWNLAPGEVWWIIEARMPRNGLSMEDADRLLEMLELEERREAANG